MAVYMSIVYTVEQFPAKQIIDSIFAAKLQTDPDMSSNYLRNESHAAFFRH